VEKSGTRREKRNGARERKRGKGRKKKRGKKKEKNRDKKGTGKKATILPRGESSAPDEAWCGGKRE